MTPRQLSRRQRHIMNRLLMLAAALLLVGLFTAYTFAGLFVFARLAAFLLGPGIPAVYAGFIGFFAFTFLLTVLFEECEE